MSASIDPIENLLSQVPRFQQWIEHAGQQQLVDQGAGRLGRLLQQAVRHLYRVLYQRRTNPASKV